MPADSSEFASYQPGDALRGEVRYSQSSGSTTTKEAFDEASGEGEER